MHGRRGSGGVLLLAPFSGSVETAGLVGYGMGYLRGVRRHDAISRSNQPERENSLAPGGALIIIVLSSLGLWFVIWLAVSSLASALP
jgi:hypothetical protein